MRIGIVAIVSLVTLSCTSAQSSAKSDPAAAPTQRRLAAAEPDRMTPAAGQASTFKKQTMDVNGWHIIKRESGPDNYYSVVNDPKLSYIQARYRPGQKTAVLGYQLDDAARSSAKKVSWKWRAVTLPKGAEECVKGKGDSVGTVYVTWKRGLRYYSIKYVWSTGGTKGTSCQDKRNPFVAQDTVLLEAGGPLGTWKSEEIDLAREFRKHFASGDQNADVPGFLGIGIMSDGDQTHSESAADYADFVLHRAP